MNQALAKAEALRDSNLGGAKPCRNDKIDLGNRKWEFENRL